MIAAIVLAAGEARRFGKLKQLMLIDGKPLLQQTLDRVHQSKVDDVLLILGAHADEIRKQVGHRAVVNRNYAFGMSTSLQAGLRALPTDVEAALIVLGDQPFVAPSTLDSLIDAYRHSKSKIVVPTCEGIRGNPVLIDRSLFARAMELRGDIGFRAVFGKEDVVEVAVDDRGVIDDVDTIEDFECLTKHSS